jgi:hypothetical protein
VAAGRIAVGDTDVIRHGQAGIVNIATDGKNAPGV